MTRAEAKSALIQAVNEHAPITAMRLLALLPVVESLLEYDFWELMDEIVNERKLIEIEYTYPELGDPERIKSLFFPKGTKILSMTNVRMFGERTEVSQGCAEKSV